ncbi:MAG: hemolysin III family protein [Acholeplasmatales bacterium]|nr:hemolysin III family protein [Acholeplasmatales bacterium]
MSEAKKNLKEIEKKERKEVKAALKEKKRLEREDEKNRPLTKEEEEERRKNEPPVRPVLEEIGNSVTHGVGAILGIIALILMLMKSDSGLKILGSLVYGIAMILMMLMSCLYHAWKSGSTVKRLWRRFDYSSIYLLIGGTFAPLQLVELGIHQDHMILGVVWFSIMWALIILGITMTSIFGPGKIKWLNFPLYFILGWSGIMFIPGLIKYNLPLLWWILIGGIVYTLGMIPFALLRKKTVSHFIWHFFVLAGAVTQFIGIYLCVYCI